MNAINSNTGTEAGGNGKPRPRKRAVVMVCILLALTILAVLRTVLGRPGDVPVTPDYKIRITDAHQQPISGVRVEHTWGISMLNYGSDERRTDVNGIAHFEPVTVTMSRLRRMEMKWAPRMVLGPFPGKDSLPIRVDLPENLAVKFQDGEWRQAIPNDPSAYTNREGVFVRYWGAYALNNPYPRPGSKVGRTREQNSVGIAFPPGAGEVDLRVCEKVEK
jgi:hypothetical protein